MTKEQQKINREAVRAIRNGLLPHYIADSDYNAYRQLCYRISKEVDRKITCREISKNNWKIDYAEEFPIQLTQGE
jgi:hypothetical protein